jgi:hypothetical protein
MQPSRRTRMLEGGWGFMLFMLHNGIFKYFLNKVHHKCWNVRIIFSDGFKHLWEVNQFFP